MQDVNFNSSFHEFIKFFQKHSKHAADHHSSLGTASPQLSDKLSKLGIAYAGSQTRSSYSQPKMQSTFYNGCNLWLLKPAEFNRGQGINLFNRLSSLEYYLKCLPSGENKRTPQSAGKKVDKERQVNLVKSNKFVIQKYVEKPLLIDNRKFDIRVWVLLDHNMNLHYFQEGYIRLSSEPFNLDENQIEDKYVHLTNNAIQKDGKNYGKHESGNIISLQQLKVKREYDITF